MKPNKLKEFFFASFVVLCFYITNTVYAEDTMFTDGFEEGQGNWKVNNSNITFNVSNDPRYEGTQSASIYSSSTGSYGIEHSIESITEDTDYLINGFIKVTPPPPSKAFIRVAWYSTDNASGSQIKTDDSEIITSETDWKVISFVAKSPALARSAKIRLLVSSGMAYFDDIKFGLNSEISPTPDITPTITITPTPEIPTVTQISSYSNIYISEIMVYPEAGQIEWVELYNDNDFDVVLSDWYIDDIKNAGSSPKKFTMTIQANGYEVLDISTAMFNNDSDTIRLLDSEEMEKDSVSYTTSQKNYSLGKTHVSNSNVCFQNPSKKMPNNNCVDISPTIIAAAVSPTRKNSVPTLKKTPSPTQGSKKLLPTLQAKKTTSLQSANAPIEQSNSENILGAATEITLTAPSPTSLIHTLTILSFSYSILSIISIITRLSFPKGIPKP